jgi:MoCo/4Fe-4S cofactor protein with predicted Tat translocation signal
MRNGETGRPDLEVLREKIDHSSGERYWRSLEELSESEDFREILRREFGDHEELWSNHLDRRRFLALMGASFALAGLSGCSRQPPEGIVPYTEMPEYLVPGRPLHFATAVPLGGVGRGVVVESHMGRPTKVEGNALHPSSVGGTDPFMQASILSLYDPDRSREPTHRGSVVEWGVVHQALAVLRRRMEQSGGHGLRIVTGAVTSPTMLAQLRGVLDRYPRARWHVWEPHSRFSANEATRLALGEPMDALFDFTRADVIVSLDDDFLYGQPGSVRYATDFASRRRVTRDEQPRMNRLYVCEPSPTVTGTMADHRLPVAASRIGTLARALAARVATGNARTRGGEEDAWLASAAADLLRHRGRSIVLAGDHQPVEVHLLAHRMNEALGNIGHTVSYRRTSAPAVDPGASLQQLALDIDADEVDAVVFLGTNPMYDAPPELELGRRVGQVAFTLHLSLYHDETSAACRWHLPRAHDLEGWSDIRGHDGAITIMQPLVMPLLEAVSPHELLAALETGRRLSSHEIVKSFWSGRHGDAGFQRFWERSLRDGVVDLDVEEEHPQPLMAPALTPGGSFREGEGIEVIFRPDPSVRYGEESNNGWLQELPKPLTKLTWDNAALMSPRTAEDLGLSTEDVVILRRRGNEIRAPVWVMAGHADDCITLPLGYGRTRAGTLGSGAGFSAFALRSLDGREWANASLEQSGDTYRLASTQMHRVMDGRDLVRSATLSHYLAEPAFVRRGDRTPAPDETMYPAFRSEPYAWAMSIDLNTCIGCNGCVVACQAENNVPIVGKEQVLVGREMHWLRIDRYFAGDSSRPRIEHQPVLCMHCENAPCEYVCPVGATQHSSEGLNEMIYARCIGTRYCSNNCPYKVRRFNFLDYPGTRNPPTLMRNPDVTVRSLGVMEKCTYCVQRINRARVDAEREGRRIRDGEVRTACQSACPTHAIVFGDLNDPDSEVSRKKREPTDYGILTELNTRPRTTYLARIRNPAPAARREES